MLVLPFTKIVQDSVISWKKVVCYVAFERTIKFDWRDGDMLSEGVTFDL